MSGITDLPFRLVAKSFGAALGCIPLISAKALCLGNQKTFDLLKSDPAERPVAVQIFGGDPETIAAAVKVLKKYPIDIIDINMGCPVPKVMKAGGGALLMRDVKLAGEVVKAAVAMADVPVTVKMRAGWDADSITAPELAGIVEEAGASAVAVHPRTKTQGFTGKADWSLIARIKKSVDIPVIGSGDVLSPEDAKRMLEETGCDFVMIGRAARGNPWIFSRTVRFLQDNVLFPEPSPEERLQILTTHCTLSARFEGGPRAALRMRKHAGWYVKSLKNAAIIRKNMNLAGSVDDIIGICRALKAEWHGSCHKRA
jgi:tRNA-dihydrouridine synthase B